MSTKYKSLVLISAVASLVLSGCFLWSSVKDEYRDFTAYFNTFYNGEQAYNEAMSDVKNSLKEYNLTLISGMAAPQFSITPAAHSNFDIAIEKASKVLQFYPNSGYTEDCLFMIGISYFYEDDYLRSGRKFIEEQSKYPSSERISEALMYYGDIELKNRNFTDGYMDLLKALRLAETNKNRNIMAQTANYLSDYFLIQGDTISAAQYLDTAATYGQNDDAAIYACRSGSFFEYLGKYGDAKREYSKAWDDARDIRLRFYSRYFLARAERHDKQYASALENLDYLRSDDKYFQYFSLIEYQKAEALYDSGSVSTAFTELQRIDTAYATTEAATRSAFRVANIYLYKVGDYQSALKYYQKTVVHTAVPIISEKARLMSTNLQDYFADLYKLNLEDSLYQRALAAASRNDSTIKHSQADIDTLYEHAAQVEEAMAGFFLFKLQIPDSAINHYEAIVSQFKNSKVYPSALYTLGEYYFSTGDTINAKNYLTELINEHGTSSFALSASSLLGITRTVTIDSAQMAYDQAINLENQNRHDSAVVVLKELLDSKNPLLTPQILYAIGWIYENKLDTPDSAYVYYKRLSTLYPASDYTDNVSLTLSGYEQAQKDSAEARKRVADSIANALKPVVRDTVREAKGVSPLNEKANPLNSQKDADSLHAYPKTSQPDSIDEIRRRTTTDSVIIHRKPIEEPKKQER